MGIVSVQRRALAAAGLAAVMLSAPQAAFASLCRAVVPMVQPTQITPHRYRVDFLVHSDECWQGGCHGFVHFALVFRRPGGNVVSIKSQARYFIHRHSDQAPAQVFWRTPADDFVLIDITRYRPSCETP